MVRQAHHERNLLITGLPFALRFEVRGFSRFPIGKAGNLQSSLKMQKQTWQI